MSSYEMAAYAPIPSPALFDLIAISFRLDYNALFRKGGLPNR